jgi:hypothetical protein
VAPPPRGKSHNLIIHLDLVEDWSPPRDRTPSYGQSGMPSSGSSESEEYPLIYNFDDWTPGVLDGLRMRPTVAACRPPPRVAQHDNDTNDDDGHRRPSKGCLERGKQAFGLLRRPGASSGNADGARQRTRSPTSSKRWGTAGEDGEPIDGDRGKKLERDGRASPRLRELMRRDDSDWERRRSREGRTASAGGAMTGVTSALLCSWELSQLLMEPLPCRRCTQTR